MLSDDEKLEKMMEKLSPQQKDNLNKIRHAVEEIWKGDHIISDFTSHGIDHSMRIIGYSYDILSCNKNDELTQDETYLLLASIYLHDIGMQCYPPEPIFSDIINEAKCIAEERNICFNCIDFKSESAMKLTDDEQKFIREYHSLLTAALINYSFKKTDYILHEACKGIQNNLRMDLTHICLYHSKYSIMDCEEYLTILEKEGRKKLIATILRLADEMDIGYNRINEDDYKILRKDPKNLIHWIKHKYTTVSLSDNEIHLKIVLNLEDAEKYGHIFQALIINKFCCKNKNLIKILNSYGYNIKMGDKEERKNGEPKIITGSSYEKISTEVLSEFKALERENRYISNCRYKYNVAGFNNKIEKGILNNSEPYKILIIGDVMLDSTMYMIDAPYDQVLTHDNLNMVFVLLPKDEYLYKNLKIDCSDRRSLGGAAGIMTTLLEIPNVYVDMIGIIGNDRQGDEIQELFKDLQNKHHENNEACSNFHPIVIDEYPTVTKYYYHCVKYNQGPPLITRYRFDREDIELIYDNIEKYKESFNLVLNEICTNYDCIIIKDHQKGMINEYVIDWISQKYPNTPIFIDPKYNFDYYKKLNIKAIIPNIKEASMGIKEIANISEEEVKKRATESRLYDEDYDLLKECLPNCDSFIIKSDINGAIIYSDDNNYHDRDYIYPLPVEESKLKSNVGCGDTFDAYFIIGQLKEYSLQTSIKLANIAAGIKRKKELGEVVSPQEVFDELNIFNKKCIRPFKDTH